MDILSLKKIQKPKNIFLNLKIKINEIITLLCCGNSIFKTFIKNITEVN